MNRRGILRLQIRSSIIFLVLFTIAIVASIIVSQYILFRSYESGKLPKILAEEISLDEYPSIDISDVRDIGGWVEILDEEGAILFFKGDKKDKDKMSYSKDELLHIISFKKDYKWIATIKGFEDKKGNKRYLLVKYPGDKINVSYNMSNPGGKVAKPFLNAVILGGVILLLVLFVGIFISVRSISKRLIKPIDSILIGIERMKRGEYVEDMSFKAEREFESIRDAFNELNTQLRNSNKKRAKVEEERNRMFRELSHDIKTPLTSIGGFSRILMEDRVSEEEKKRYYETIFLKSERARRLIDNLFEHVKLDGNDFVINRKEGDICEFLRRIISEFYDEFYRKEMNLTINIPEEAILLYYDGFLLQRAISNIIENIIKYNPHKTHVRIELKYEEELVLEIADNGVGIPDDMKGVIFDPFTRGDKSRGFDGGSGLGLSITKRILDLHQWKISIGEDSEEEKTIFSIKIK